MKQTLFITAVLLLFAFSAKAQQPTLDEVLAKYYKSTGFDKMQGISTIVMTGTMIQQDAMPMKIIKKRPNKYMMEFDVQDKTAYQVYDGQKAWMTATWTTNPKPQLMPEERAKDVKSKADFDGPIYDWKAKGHQAELVGIENIAGAKVYKIKFTRSDAVVEHYFIDSESYLLLMKSSFRKVQGQEVEVENYMKDYRNIGGIMFPFESENRIGGNLYNSIQYDTIEVNTEVNDKIFVMPE